MKKFIIYPLMAIVTAVTAVSVIYRKVISEAATNIYHHRIKPILKKAPKQRKKTVSKEKTASSKKAAANIKKVSKQNKQIGIKLVKKEKPKAQRQKSKNVASIK